MGVINIGVAEHQNRCLRGGVLFNIVKVHHKTPIARIHLTSSRHLGALGVHPTQRSPDPTKIYGGGGGVGISEPGVHLAKLQGGVRVHQLSLLLRYCLLRVQWNIQLDVKPAVLLRELSRMLICITVQKNQFRSLRPCECGLIKHTFDPIMHSPYFHMRSLRDVY